MAKRRRSKRNDPANAGGGLVLLIALIITYVQNHSEQIKHILYFVILGLACFLVAYVIYIILSNLIHYSTARCLSVFGNTSALNSKATMSIKTGRGWTIFVPEDNEMKVSELIDAFNRCSRAMNEALDSQEYDFVVDGGDEYRRVGSKYLRESDGFLRKRSRLDRIKSDGTFNPIVVRFENNKRRGYSFIIYPFETFAYVSGAFGTKFIACYKTSEFFDAKIDNIRYTKSVIVYEKTQNSIECYYHYCPVKDATILGSTNWQVTNKNGSRSFKGGLLPEHNPLIFRLRYGLVIFKFGNYKEMVSLSNCRCVEDFEEYYKESYFRMVWFSAKPSDVEILSEQNDEEFSETEQQVLKSEVTYNPTDYISSVNAGLAASTVESAMYENENSEIEEETPEINSEDDSEEENLPLSLDELRARNKRIFKMTCDKLNESKCLGGNEFKVYQCRKDYDIWKKTDAGVYTYIQDYCLELNIHSNQNGIESLATLLIKSDNLNPQIFSGLSDYYHLNKVENRLEVIGKYNCQRMDEYSLALDMYYIMEMFAKDVMDILAGKAINHTSNRSLNDDYNPKEGREEDEIYCSNVPVTLKSEYGEIRIDRFDIKDIVRLDYSDHESQLMITYQIIGTANNMQYYYITLYDTEGYALDRKCMDLRIISGKFKRTDDIIADINTVRLELSYRD